MIKGLYKCFDHWFNHGTTWIYSDLHLADEDMIALADYPYVDDHIKRINSKVGKNDVFICLGDVSKEHPEFAAAIKGYKILICGNHDRGGTTYSDIWDEVYTGPVMIGEKIILSHEPIPDLTWAMNIHGHCHGAEIIKDPYHYNVAADVQHFTPVNFNQWVKQGYLKPIDSLHRTTIDTATKRKEKRYEGKK